MPSHARDAARLWRRLPASTPRCEIGWRTPFVAMLIVSLNLAPQIIKADPVSCDAPDLGLTIGGEKQEIDALLKQATICVRQQQPARAVAIFSEVIKADPLNASAYLNRGSAQAALGEVGFALGDYGTALKLKPDMTEAWYNRGTVFMRMHRFESAMADFTEAIRLKPNFSLAYCNRGVADVELARYDDALADYSIAIGQNQEI